MFAKLFIISYLAMGAITVIAARPDGICPEIDPVDKTIYLSDLDNCAGYYACSGGYANHMYCPQGTYWDPYTEYCEVGAITAKCGNRPTTEATPLKIEKKICFT